ncbi:MAG TPA: HAD family hydrolase [Solirubrobacterales bacterium]|nr:HAD family hydrolase [Solirubrobacterales bacterium]
MIRAVTFDFWNTIARLPPGAMTEARQRAIARACAENEVELEAELLASSLEDVGLHWEEAWAAGRHLYPREGAARLVEALGVGEAAQEAVAEAFLGAGREVPLELAPDIGEALAALAGRGVRIGIVCDVGFSGGELLRELLAREGLLGYFSGWSFSDEVGAYKPSAQSFEAALRALAAEPAEALHVGDLRRTDVAGAAALGMTTVRYTGMHDDPDVEGGPEAEVVIDSHLDLLGLLDD